MFAFTFSTDTKWVPLSTDLGGGCGDWIELAQDRVRWRELVSTVMNFRVPKKRGIS